MKIKYNFLELQIYLQDKFLGVIPILFKSKDNIFIKDYLIKFYTDLLQDLNNNIEFVSDDTYSLEWYNDVVKSVQIKLSKTQFNMYYNDNYNDYMVYEIIDFFAMYFKKGGNILDRFSF
jgi:hypothetical protein